MHEMLFNVAQQKKSQSILLTGVNLINHFVTLLLLDYFKIAFSISAMF